MDYLTSETSYQAIAKKYDIPSKNRVFEWVSSFKANGMVALEQHYQRYSSSFKENAVRLYISTDYSYLEVANICGLYHSSTLQAWHAEMAAKGIVPSGKDPNGKKTEKRLRRSICEKTRERVRGSSYTHSHFKRIEETAFRTGSSEQKARIIHSLRGSFALKDILAVTGYPKSTYMYWQKRFERENPDQEIEEAILKIRKKHENYGYRRIHAELIRSGYEMNIKKVHRLTKKLELQVTSFTRKSRRYNSYKGKVGRIAPNRVNRRFYTNIPHQKITTDTTEFKYYELDDNGQEITKKLYLDPFLDMYNSEIVTYRISKKPSAQNIMDGLKEAITITKDCPYRRTFHSDQGWAYQMKDYVRTLKQEKIFQSMSRKGTCLDNSIMENFFGIMKQEIYYGHKYMSFESLKNTIETYISYYNAKRIKAKLGWLSPIEYRIQNQAA